MADAGIYEVSSLIDMHCRESACDLTVVEVPDLVRFTPPAGEKTRYHAHGGAVSHQSGRCFNRPHYSSNTNAFILTGDRPMVKFATAERSAVIFCSAVKRGITTKWLHEFNNITAAFQPASTTWLATDPAFPVCASDCRC